VTDGFGACGGIAQYNRDFLAAAAGRGHGISVVPRRGSSVRLPEGVRQVRAVPNKAAYAIAALRESRRLRPDVVFCGHLYHAPLAGWLARLTGAVLIAQLHGIEVWGPMRARCVAALEGADLILAVSRDTRARALALLDVAPERIAVLNNTVRPQFTPGDRLAARQRFGLADEFALLTVGRLDPREAYKGHDRVIPLLGRLAEHDPRVTYLVAGAGDDRARLETLGEANGVAGRVRFLGQVDDDALPDLYRAADLFALPSRGEGFGIAFLEAMACGTPAIGLDEGGARDALGEGALGACVAEDAFAEALLRLVTQGGRSGPDLADEVQARFGNPVFAGRVALHLEALQRAA
jgi:phosphatidylinositol alpha-1,6-mannosyltransferase